jgi:hypothetical protein
VRRIRRAYIGHFSALDTPRFGTYPFSGGSATVPALIGTGLGTGVFLGSSAYSSQHEYGLDLGPKSNGNVAINVEICCGIVRANTSPLSRPSSRASASGPRTAIGRADDLGSSGLASVCGSLAANVLVHRRTHPVTRVGCPPVNRVEGGSSNYSTAADTPRQAGPCTS